MKTSDSTAAFELTWWWKNRVVVETKCKDALHPVDDAQLLSHLRLLNISVGLLINFHVVILKHGIRRLVNRLPRATRAGNLTAKFAKDAKKPFPS